MSVREYIGARYIPLFMGDWDNSNTYEPLSIVSYQGNSYTSRQYVPAGIDITNESYWALSGNYNAQVEAYRQEVMAFDERITLNANAILRLSTLEIVIFGDSFSADVVNVNKWPYYLKQMHDNIVFHNYAIGGGTLTNSVPSQIITAENDTSYDKNEVKIVLVFGGVNDRAQGIARSTIITSLNASINSIKQDYPNADIYFVYNTATPIYQAVYNDGLAIVDEMISAHGIKACTMFGWILPTDYSADFVHPKESGWKRIASNMNALFFGGELHYVKYKAVCEAINYTNCTEPETSTYKTIGFYVNHINDRVVDIGLEFYIPIAAANDASFETPDVNTFGLGIIIEKYINNPIKYGTSINIEYGALGARLTQHLVSLAPNQDFRYKLEGRMVSSGYPNFVLADTFQRIEG